MEINNEINQNYNEDSNDEDNDEYYLQSMPGTYDIQEKIKAANDELFEDFDNYNNISREQRVTFREELVDYEPDFSSDDGYVHSPDALSVISDNENEVIQEEVTQEIIYTIDEENDLEIKSFQEFSEESYEFCERKTISFFETIDETIEPNIIEELENIEENLDKSDNEVEEQIFDEELIEIVEIVNVSVDEEIETNKISNNSIELQNSDNDKTEPIIKSPKLKKEESLINCRIHCLEKKDLDSITGRARKSADTLKGPVLKLRQRSCCTNQEVKPKLPVYNGFISEYGLTKSQLERRQLRKEKNAQRKREKCIRIKEEKMQKDLYNEEIFCAWLKSVKNRNQNIKNNENKSDIKESKVIEANPLQNKRQRPKTANIYQSYPSLSNKNVGNKKRPNTSPCKVYNYNIFIV